MPPSECPEEHELLAVLDGAESADVAAEHVAGCSECRRRLDYLQAGMTRLSNVIAWTSGAPAVMVGPAGSRGDAPTFLGRFFVAGVVEEDEHMVVYRGAHALVHTEVLLALAKQPLPADAAARQPLLSEGKRLMALSHPRIARVLDLDFDGERPFLVTEHVAGCDLATYIADVVPALDERVRIIANVADAVATLHDAGTVHCDLCARNIVIDTSGKPYVAGLGRAQLTAYGSRGVVPHAAATSTQQDLRALGKLLFYALVGNEAPPAANGKHDLVACRTRLLACGVSDTVVECCLKALDDDSSRALDARSWGETLAGKSERGLSGWMWWGIIAAGVVAAGIIRKLLFD